MSVSLIFVEDVLREKNRKLKYEKCSRNDFWSSAKMTPKLEIQKKQVWELNSAAVECKRQGNLYSANSNYCKSFRLSTKFDSEIVWAWCKVLMLAKAWNSLQDLLEYHFNIMVVWNRLMRDEDNKGFFEGYKVFNMKCHFEFKDYNPGEYLRDYAHCSFVNRQDTELRLGSFGGSQYWKNNYFLSETEYIEFLEYFPFPVVEKDWKTVNNTTYSLSNNDTYWEDKKYNLNWRDQLK